MLDRNLFGKLTKRLINSVIILIAMESIVKSKLEDDTFLKALIKFKGSAKVKISDEELEEIKEKVIKDFVKEKGWKLD